MKRAGDLLSVIIDNKMVGKAREYTKLFSAWDQLTQKHGISAAAAHSRIRDVRRGILLVEADHPGWIQILRTKESVLLLELKKMFRELDICGIAFMLNKSPPDFIDERSESRDCENKIENKEDSEQLAPGNPPEDEQDTLPVYHKIKDGLLKKKLESLEKSITLRKELKTKKG